MPYIGVSPQFGVRRKHTYTATAGQTSFSGAGSEGATLSYTDSNFVDVYQNGVKLGDADYTSTSGTAIVLAQGASVDDLVEIIVFDAFSAADTVSKADGGQFDNDIKIDGTLTVVDDVSVEGSTPTLTLADTDVSNNKVELNYDEFLTIDLDPNNARGNTGLIVKGDGSEHMRIDSNGAVLINSTARNDLGVVEILTTIGTDNAMIIKTAESGASGSATAMKFRFNSSTTGSIGYSSSGTSFNTSSDYRLKENVEYSFDATTELKKLKPCKFNFKTDKDRIVEGFLAHEVQDIVPQAITGKKDEVDEDDNPVYQGIDQSKLVPLLVKSLQEALAEIDTLKTKVAALESK